MAIVPEPTEDCDSFVTPLAIQTRNDSCGIFCDSRIDSELMAEMIRWMFSPVISLSCGERCDVHVKDEWDPLDLAQIEIVPFDGASCAGREADECCAWST